MLKNISVAAAFVAAFLLPAQARDVGQVPANSPHAQWFKSLKQPGTGMSCCDVSDCHKVEFDVRAEQYVAKIEGRWVLIPPEKIVHDAGNPTGSAVACYLSSENGIHLYCFIPGALF